MNGWMRGYAVCYVMRCVKYQNKNTYRCQIRSMVQNIMYRLDIETFLDLCEWRVQ